MTSWASHVPRPLMLIIPVNENIPWAMSTPWLLQAHCRPPAAGERSRFFRVSKFPSHYLVDATQLRRWPTSPHEPRELPNPSTVFAMGSLLFPRLWRARSDDLASGPLAAYLRPNIVTVAFDPGAVATGTGSPASNSLQPEFC